MFYVLQALGAASNFTTPHVGKFVSYFDPDAMDGRGEVRFTDNPRQAIRFTDQAAALRFYQTVSNVRPLRPDGKPNKPLTSYHMGIEPIDEIDPLFLN